MAETASMYGFAMLRRHVDAGYGCGVVRRDDGPVLSPWTSRMKARDKSVEKIRDVDLVRRRHSPSMNRNGYIVSMRPAKLGRRREGIEGEGPRGQGRQRPTVDDGVREVGKPAIRAPGRRGLSTGNASGPSNEPPFMNDTPSTMSPVAR